MAAQNLEEAMKFPASNPPYSKFLREYEVNRIQRQVEESKSDMQKEIQVWCEIHEQIKAIYLTYIDTQKGLIAYLRRVYAELMADSDDREQKERDRYVRLKKEYDILIENHQAVKSDNEKMASLISHRESRGPQEISMTVSHLQTKVSRLKRENENLLHRLSRLASSKLTEGNPAIVDLSDEKRPTKLAEIYSELYDNEWTSAFDEQLVCFHGDEERVIHLLLDILLTTHRFCQELSKKCLQDLWSAILNIGRFEAGQKRDAPAGLQKSLCAARATAAPIIRRVVKQNLTNEWSKRNIHMMTELNNYAEKCLGLCWDMSVKDPPVVLMSLPEIGSDYDKDRYRFYTQSGTRVAYVVWPGMLLHEGSPTLAKGVIQGCINQV